jgi:hypothetical protein
MTVKKKQKTETLRGADLPTMAVVDDTTGVEMK